MLKDPNDIDDDRVLAMAAQVANILRDNVDLGPATVARPMECLEALAMVGGLIVKSVPEGRPRAEARAYLMEALEAHITGKRS